MEYLSPRFPAFHATVCALALAGGGWISTSPADDLSTIAGPVMAPDYAHDGPVKIRFSSYAERPFPANLNGAVAAYYKGPRLLNVPEQKEYVAKLAAIDADEGFVYMPGEMVLMHVLAIGGPATIEVRAMVSHKTQTFTVDGEKTIPLALDPPGGADDFQLYQVEATQNGKVVARRGFVSMLPTGDVVSCHDVMGTLGWEFIEWEYTPFDECSGFEGAQKNHGPLYGKFDDRLQPWNWTTDVYNPDIPKDRVRVPDPGKDWLAQPYTEWARYYQYFGADLSSWKPESWRWGEFYDGDFQYHERASDGQPGITLEAYSYTTANDSIMPSGMYLREWLGSIYNAVTRQATQVVPHQKVRIAEADMWNDRDASTVPISPRILEMYVDYVKAKGLPHDDLDKARNSAELADLVLNSGSVDRKEHYKAWNMYQVNLRGRQYLWEDAVKNGLEANGLKKVDWLYGNGLVGDNVQGCGQGDIPPDFELWGAPWYRFEFQTDWDYMHWQSGSYRCAGQSFARTNAVGGQRIFNPDVYNEKVPHSDPAQRNDTMFSCWCVPQDAAEHNRMFTYTSFLHYYDSDARPQRVVNMDYENLYRNSQGNSLGVLMPNTPSDEAHALLDHRQLSEGITMEQPIGFVGVVSSMRAEDVAQGKEYIANRDTWAWFFETLCDDGVSLPAFIDASAAAKLPATTNLIFAAHKDGKGNLVISARVNGQTITEPWKSRDRASVGQFVADILKASNYPVKFSDGTTGFAYTFRGNRALVYVENMRNSHVSDSDRNQPRPSDINEQPRVATVDVAVPFSAEGAQVWDLTGFLPVTQVQAANGRVKFTAPLRAGDGRLFVIVPAHPAPISQSTETAQLGMSRDSAMNQLYVPWAKTAYEKVAYRNPFFLSTPKPYGGRNYTQIGEAGTPAPTVPARATAPADAPASFDGTSPLLKMIAPNAVVVVGENAPDAIKATANALAAAIKKDGGSGEIITAAKFDAMPVSETGKYHVIAVGTIWDNELLQRFNDPWGMDRDFTYGALGNQPPWPWMPKTGFNVGWIGDFGDDDPSVGYLVVDRSSFMWEQRAKSFDSKNPPDHQMPLRLFFRVTGSGPAGVVKAAKAFADDGLLNGCLPDKAPTGDPRYTLTPDRIPAKLALTVPTSVDAGSGHSLTYLGWNQADAEEYDGFFSRTKVEPQRIERAKYVPEWGMTNFLASPHRASSYFELCVVDLPDENAAKQAAGALAGSDSTSVTLANGAIAQKAKYGTLIVTQGKSLILESAPDPWGKALLEAYLKQ